jgi:phenylalanyl-tRNA synthetase beta chain
MKASYRWIAELLPSLTLSPLEVGELFSSAGIAVDGLSELGEGTAAIVLATVVNVEPHPARDKLRLVTVDRGDIQQRVVCGASNVPEPPGQVCFAPLGSHLPAVAMTLTSREIGGIVSEGMLCSEVELGLAAFPRKDEDHGLLVFPAGFAPPGTPLRKALPAVHDWILELDLTPNRGDALGHVGLAREVSALTGSTFSRPAAPSPTRRVPGNVGDVCTVIVEDPERCPQYGAAAVRGVCIGPSPHWVRYRLESLGIRSISNVVDVTNLVMLEYGHPLHAFDFDRVRDSKIVVRRARNGEKLTTLDDVERILVPDDLVIADGEGPLALAGVMGGDRSGIGASTKNILLECAYFTPRGIRRSSRRHALHSDASHRFERGVDVTDIPDAIARATSLLVELAGGQVVPGTVFAGSAPRPRDAIRLRASRMNALLGITVPFADATQILTRLGCDLLASHGAGELAEAEVAPPFFRPDLQAENDLIDEVLRVHGLDKVPPELPAIRPQPSPGISASDRVRRAALELGLSETVTLGFVSPADIAALGLPEGPIVLQNPLGEERSVMRTSLLPGLLDAVRRARRHGVNDVRLFSLGSTFFQPPEGSLLPDEVPSFAAVLAGSRREPLQKASAVEVYDAKGIAQEIVERATGRNSTVMPQSPSARTPFLHPRAAGNVLVGGDAVGCFGVLHPTVCDRFDLGSTCVVVDLDVRALERLGYQTPRYVPIPTLPAATRDISVTVHEDVTAGAVGDALREAAGDLCESVELFDVFRGEQLPKDHRSLAFHVVYRDPKAATDPDHARTLTDDEVDHHHAAAESALLRRFGAVLRA